MEYLVLPMDSADESECFIHDSCAVHHCGDCSDLCVLCDGYCGADSICGGHSTRSLP